MDYKRAIHAIEKEKRVYERLLRYNMKSKVNFRVVIGELDEAIKLLKSRSVHQEVKPWNYSSGTRNASMPISKRG